MEIKSAGGGFNYWVFRLIGKGSGWKFEYWLLMMIGGFGFWIFGGEYKQEGFLCGLDPVMLDVGVVLYDQGVILGFFY